jgi:hypothetical protein
MFIFRPSGLLLPGFLKFHYVQGIDWKGEGKMDVAMGKFFIQGLFIRMPWYRKRLVKTRVFQDTEAWNWRDSLLSGGISG